MIIEYVNPGLIWSRLFITIISSDSKIFYIILGSGQPNFNKCQTIDQISLLNNTMISQVRIDIEYKQIFNIFLPFMLVHF
jgi:hypothetical protein